MSMGPNTGTCGSTIIATARLEYKISNPDEWVPLEGKVISFTLGSASGSGVTDSDGVATASLIVNPAASLSAGFNGDENSNLVTTTIPFSVSGLCGISPASGCFTYEGGSSSINVSAAAGLNWTAESDSDWVVITSGSSGTGDGTVSFTVDPNPTSTRRTALITVEDKTFTVKQSAHFTDVPPDHLFFSEINILSANGITVGCAPDFYCPDEVVTRQQMAAFIIRALGEFNPPAPLAQRFDDVPPENIFYGFIEEMAVRQITQGCGGNNYCPQSPVLREQMAAFIIRALGEQAPPTPATQRFADVDPTNPFYNYIDRMAELGITFGCGNGNYCPGDGVTRGQMAAFLNRAFHLCQ